MARRFFRKIWPLKLDTVFQCLILSEETEKKYYYGTTIAICMFYDGFYPINKFKL
jgi:hypothetical protein